MKSNDVSTCEDMKHENSVEEHINLHTCAAEDLDSLFTSEETKPENSTGNLACLEEALHGLDEKYTKHKLDAPSPAGEVGLNMDCKREDVKAVHVWKLECDEVMYEQEHYKMISKQEYDKHIHEQKIKAEQQQCFPVHDEKPFICGVCGFHFKYKDDLKIHLRNIHDTGSDDIYLEGPNQKLHETAPCTNDVEGCLKTNGAKASDMETKMKMSTTEKLYRCQMCDKTFMQSSELHNHIRKHPHEDPCKCQVYKKTCKCQVYKKTFTWPDKLKNHYMCGVCNKSFTNNSNLKVHMRTHTGEKPFKCEVCDKTFTQLQHLKQHLRTHPGEEPLKCKICDKTFLNACILKAHMKTHTDYRLYKCEQCYKAFTYASDLKVHTRIHTGERPYKCGECNKAFTQAGSLKIHMRTHSGERPYKCGMCNKSFTTTVSVRLHMRTHTREKPLQCNVCEKAFTWHSSLKQHMRSHIVKH